MNVFHKFALQSLKQNRTRTIVTIIGIILSVSMLTAVTTTLSSVQQYLLDVTIQESGSWHAMISDIFGKQAEDIEKREEVDESGALKNVCYARLQEPLNADMPYLYVGAMEGKFDQLLSVHMKEGRLPKNSGEIILPEDLGENGGINYKVGDTLSLSSGTRRNVQGQLLWQRDIMRSKEDETFVESGKTAYRIVGFYQSASLDNGSVPGYTALTKASAGMADLGENIYVTLQDAGEVESFLKQVKPEQMNSLQAGPVKDKNRMYLIYSGNPTGSALKTIGGLMAILIGIIMFGSVALIGNSFSISVNERKKQYGLLSSIGATKKQLRRNVLFEASVLSAIGIPLGVLAGVGGMSVTFYFVSGILKDFLGEGLKNSSITLQMSAAVWAVVMAAVIGFVTVLISAYLPARKALKTSAIDVIRQSQDVRIRPRQVRTSKLTQKLFGLEGTLASKNFKRNRRKYRATVFSLFISVVLFISATSFCDYLSNAMETIIMTYSCDIRVHDEKAPDSLPLYQKLKGTKGVTKASYYWGVEMETMPSVVVPDASVSKQYRGEQGQLSAPMDEHGNEMKSDTQMIDNVQIFFVEDKEFNGYLKDQGLDPAQFSKDKGYQAVAYDDMMNYTKDGKLCRYSVFDQKPSELTLCYEKKQKDGYVDCFQRRVGKDGKLEYRICKMEQSKQIVYEDGSTETEEQEVKGSGRWVSADKLYDMRKTGIGAMVDQVPFGTDATTGYGLVLFYPESAMETVCPKDVEMGLTMAFNSSNPTDTDSRMCEVLKNNKRSTGNLYNIDKEVQASRALMLVMRIFSYGFILLISLIAMANVFNTISTNILLRRREFAMLQSVGMTDKGFRRMMNLECILYGCKGLFFGLLVAIGVTYLIYRALSNELVFAFYIPWYSIVIAIASVFLVVFATMLYAMSKIKKDNVVETLKQENY